MKLENQDEVVISGIGGHFPKSRNIEEFKKALLNNECLLDSRWKAGIFLNINNFEHNFKNCL